MNARDYYLDLLNAIHDHRHDDQGVHPSAPMTIPEVLDALLKFI